MGQAYVPGLKVSERSIVHKERVLPLKGEIKVKKGDAVQAEQVVAATSLPGNVELVNVVNKLAITANELAECMLVKEGEDVSKDQMIAQSKGFFGMFKSSCLSPAAGKVESISSITGQVVIREAPVPVEVHAYVEGVVEEIHQDVGVTVKLQAAHIQGVFGIGGEVVGNICVVSRGIEDELVSREVLDEHKDKIIVGGAFIGSEALKKAVAVGVKGIIVGGIDAKDLRDFLGYDIGVAITGSEEVGLTLIVTEGFGKINMAKKTHDLLSKHNGKKASINGATQIRAGVIRPEIIIPLPKVEESKIKEAEVKKDIGMAPGKLVRIIREPDFGSVVKIKSLPVQLTTLESETKVRVVEVEYPDGATRLVPRANIEIIEL
ncbi:MAG: hypothetical protein PHQ23_02225 [Candidatus Wallbacteria bacterium]|nr:hypothetical protein [Candidatus Wallbacteria bacterium]